MPSAYTTLLGLVQPTTGELSGTWGTTVNQQLTQLVEDAIAGAVTVDVTAGNHTLTTTGSGAQNEARMAILTVIGTPGVSRDVYAPKLSKVYIVENRSDAAVVLRGGPGSPTTGVRIPAGATMTLAWDSVAADFRPAGVAITGSTGSAALPVGTTAQRDASPTAGLLRFNTTGTRFEGYNGSAWSGLGGATGGGADAVFYVNDRVVNTAYTIVSTQGAMTVGPITYNAAVTVDGRLVVL